MSKSRRNLILVFVSFCVGMLFFIPYIRFSFYDQTLIVFGINHTQMGLLGSAYGAVAIAGYFVSGLLASRFEPKKLIALSCFATGIITVWLALIPSFTQMVVIYVLYSIFTIATLWSPYLVIIRELGSDSEQGRLFGLSDSMRNVFSAIAGFAFVYIFSLFANESAGYKGMLYVSVGLYAIFGILSLVIIPKFHTGDASKGKTDLEKEKEDKVSLKDSFKIPGVWLMGIFIFACYSAIITQTNYLGTFTTIVLGFDESVSSALAVTRNYLIPIFAGIVGGFLVDKAKSRVHAFIVLLAVMAAVCVAILFTRETPAVCNILTMCLSAVAMMILATYWSIMPDCGIPERNTAVATGIVSCICYLPDAFITIIIGRWIDADLFGGFTKMFIWMIVWVIVAIAVAAVILIRNAKVKKQA